MDDTKNDVNRSFSKFFLHPNEQAYHFGDH